jgi:hypothetical protein
VRSPPVTQAHAELHQNLPELAARTLLQARGPEAAALEAHAREGCSTCARALVNTREVSVDLALVARRSEPPPEHLRSRVLLAAKSALARRPTSFETSSATREGQPLDPSAAVARLHATHEIETARALEITSLKDTLPALADAAERSLAELERATGFPIHFATLVLGDKVTALAQRGLPAELGSHRDIPRHASFCTHTISADAPFVVENAAREPFFRGSKVVLRYGIHAYVGAPIRSRRAIPLGTVCALDFTPRRIPPALVQAVSLCAEKISSALGASPVHVR